jgi:hypothetical protein
MPFDLSTVEPLVDKKVIITYNLSEPDEDGNTATEVEATMMAVAPGIGIMVRPRGKQQGLLIEENDIENIVQVAAVARPIKQKLLREMNLDDVRQHLADRHGVAVTWLNAAAPQQAFDYHADIDHSDLAHTHGSAAQRLADGTQAADTADLEADAESETEPVAVPVPPAQPEPV